jgi:hypothetical protein
MPNDLLLRVDRKLAGAGSAAAIYDEKDELDFYTEFGLVEHAFADPSLLRRRLDGQRVRVYFDDDCIPPRLFGPIAARDPCSPAGDLPDGAAGPGLAWNAAEQLARHLDFLIGNRGGGAPLRWVGCVDPQVLDVLVQTKPGFDF